MTYEVRSAGAADYALAEDLLFKGWEYHHNICEGRILLPERPCLNSEAWNGLTTESGIAKVGTYRHQPCAIAVSTELCEERAFLSHLYVDTDHRRKGIAGRLVRLIEESWAARGKTTLALEVNIRNKLAFKFYSALGYTRPRSITGIWEKNIRVH